MAHYEALKAKVQELAERDRDVPAIEARMKRLSQDGIPRKKLDPKEILANKEQILDRVQRRAEQYNLLESHPTGGRACIQEGMQVRYSASISATEHQEKNGYRRNPN